MNKMKRILTIVLTLALIVTMMPMNLTNVNAKSTTRLSSKKIVLQVGKTKKLKVKNRFPFFLLGFSIKATGEMR